MSINFGDNLDKSFAYANNVFKSFGSWFILIVLYTLVIGGAIAMVAGVFILAFGYLFIVDPTIAADPSSAFVGAMMLPVSICLIAVGIVVSLVLGFFINGINVRVYRGGELSLLSPGKMFVEGLLASIILFIYMIPYAVVSTVTAFGPMDNIAYLIVVGVIIPIILYLATMLIGLFGVIRYAKTGSFGSAFEIGKICHLISNIGWLRYLGYFILFSLIVGIIVTIIYLIPIVGIILGIVVSPFVAIMTARFFGNLYESAEN